MDKTVKDRSVVLKDEENIGAVQIADDVVSMVACLAALEVEGVYCIANGATAEALKKSGYSKLPKGVRIEVVGKEVAVSLAITMSYGYSIPATSSKVQEKVKASVESMTGLNCTDVNLRVMNIRVK